MEAETSTW